MPTRFISDLLAEIDVPVDGTLSRVLHKDDRIRLVAFGFAAGQELTQHTSSSAAIVQVVSGRIVLTSAGTVHSLGPTSWLCLPPNQPHSLEAVEPSVVLLTLVTPGAIADPSDPG